MATNKRFGELVGVFRQRACVSQSELARLAGIDASHLNRIERGLRGSPRRKTVEALCRAFLLDEAERAELLDSAGYASERRVLPAGVFGAPPADLLMPSGRKMPPRPNFAEDVAGRVSDILSDRSVPEYERRALARQVRSFVDWLAAEARGKQGKPKARKHLHEE
jgi:transcriptional regulator with XRE-family HTH domain